MAIYHQNLQYHEDNTEKHSITRDESEFLIALQKEMNTQDNLGQADPRYWVIKGSEKLYHVEDEEDGIELYDTDGCGTVADGLDEILEFIKEELFGDADINRLDTADEIEEWLDERGYDEYKAIPYKIVPKIYENTMFLTQKAAEEHLRANDYHYSEDAHTYAMTAWRSPEVERLWKILRTVEFGKILEV